MDGAQQQQMISIPFMISLEFSSELRHLCLLEIFGMASCTQVPFRKKGRRHKHTKRRIVRIMSPFSHLLCHKRLEDVTLRDILQQQHSSRAAKSNRTKTKVGEELLCSSFWHLASSQNDYVLFYLLHRVLCIIIWTNVFVSKINNSQRILKKLVSFFSQESANCKMPKIVIVRLKLTEIWPKTWRKSILKK